MHQLQAHLAGLSTRGKQAIVEDSNHGIPFQGRTLWSTPSRRSSLRFGKSRAATRESRSEKRIIKGRPFAVGFDCSHQAYRKEHPHE